MKLPKGPIANVNSISKMLHYYASDRGKKFPFKYFFSLGKCIRSVRLDIYGTTTDASDRANFVPINKLPLPLFTWAISSIFTSPLIKHSASLLAPFQNTLQIT